MPKIILIAPDGVKQEIEADNGTSVMRAAVREGVRGIVGDCGGDLACATCHVYVDEAWLAEVGEPSRDEDDMLELTASPRAGNSRLSCQIRVSERLDGLVVRLPEEQW